MGLGNPISSRRHSALQSESITANEPGDRIKYPLIAVPREGLCQLSLPHASPSRWELRYQRVISHAQKAAWVLATGAKWKEEKRADWGARIGLKHRVFSVVRPHGFSIVRSVLDHGCYSSFAKTRCGILRLLLRPLKGICGAENQIRRMVRRGWPPPAPARRASPLLTEAWRQGRLPALSALSGRRLRSLARVF